MSGSPFGIGEFLSADKQSDAAKHAANTAADAQMHGINVMYEMWEKAQADFAPFLEAGGQGLATLTQSMPQYMNNVLAPLAQQIASFQYSQPLNPQFGQVNPVTGEIMQPTQMQLGQNQQIGAGGNFMDLNRNAPSIPASQTQLAQQYSPAVPNQSAPSAATAQGAAPMLSAPTKPNEFLPGGGTIQMDYGARGEGDLQMNIPNPQYAQQMQQYEQDLAAYQAQQAKGVTTTPEPTPPTPPQPTPIAQPTQIPTAGNQLSLPNYQVGATQEQMQQGGVLSPLTPTLPGQIDMQWNPDDPVYQYKLGQAEDAQKRYLAAIGMTNSSPALTKMRDTGLAVAAEDIDKQFARQQTERNYLAQKMADEYGMQAQRGQTLYDRQTAAGQEAYARNQMAISQYDQNRLNQLMQAYNAYGNQYGLGYGSALDLAKIGAGQAGAAGSSSMQTGQGIANAYGNIGDAQANAGLAQSNIWANYMSGLSNQGSQIGNQLMNYFQNQNQPQAGGGYSGYTTNPTSMSNYGYSGGYMSNDWAGLGM